MSSHWARLGDTGTIRYVEETEYYNPDTGEVYGPWENVPEGANYVDRVVKYRDVEYTVAALVTVPSALSYRYYGADEFVMGAETFIRDTGTDSVMYYAFDTTEEANSAMEAFLKDYTENENPQFDYESKATYAGEFESTRSMFLLLGGALSFIVGLVGVLAMGCRERPRGALNIAGTRPAGIWSALSAKVPISLAWYSHLVAGRPKSSSSLALVRSP